MGKTLVTAKVNPDLDGTSCILAYADFLRKKRQNVEGFVFGDPQSEVQYFIKEQHIHIPLKKNEKSSNWDSFILVDASSLKGMPKVVIPEKVLEIIDHRVSEPEKEFPNAKVQNDLIGAAATIVVERYIKEKLKLEKDYAKLLYGAIFHNTLNFIATNATKRDKAAADFLEKEYKLDKNMSKKMFDFATKIIEKDVNQAIEDDAKEFEILNKKLGVYQLVVWGGKILNQKQKISKVIKKIDFKMGSPQWSFLNIINLERNKSNIYCSNSKGQQILSQAINCKFDNNWCELDGAWLRKQILPKVNEVLGKK